MNACLGGWRTQAAVGLGIKFSKFEFNGHETWLDMRRKEIENQNRVSVHEEFKDRRLACRMRQMKGRESVKELRLSLDLLV